MAVQAGVPEREKLYRLAGGDVDRYEDHVSFVCMFFHTLDRDAVGRLVRSLL
jgi:hypothetical protein